MAWRRNLLLSALLALTGCGGTVLLEGRVDLFGSMPRPYLGMVTTEGEHVRLQGALSEELSARYQGRQLRLRATLVAPAGGPGQPAVYEIQTIEGSLER